MLSAHTCKHSSQSSQCIIFTMDVEGHRLWSNFIYKKNFLLLLDSFHARGDFFSLLVTFANSLDPDQNRPSVGSDLEPNCLTLIVFLKEFFGKKG